MSRYRHTRIVPNSAAPSLESSLSRNHFAGQPSQQILTPNMTTTTTPIGSNSSNSQSPYGSFRSTFIPFVTNGRTITPNNRKIVQIPITREDGTSIINSVNRSIPITFMGRPSTSTPTTFHNDESSTDRSRFTSYLRPGSKSFRHHFHTNNGNADSMGTPRLPSAPRRLSLTIPVMTSTNTNDDRAKQYQPSSPVHPIPIHLPPAAHMTSIPVHRSRISSAVPRSSPMRSSVNNQLQRQKSDIADRLSSDFSVTSFNVSPVRRNELMAREAIDGVARFQQQQLENSAATDDEDNNNYTSARSPSLSRRVIINLKNNQSISLDSRLSSANPSSFINPPPAPSSTRASQRNNLYHIPVLHSAPAPSPLATRSADTFDRQSSSPSVSPRQNSSYKNEFHLEIPVTFVSSNDQENQRQHARGLADYDQQQSTMFNELMGSASPYSNQALKSILKRSSSRDTISRKNVSFMNV